MPEVQFLSVEQVLDLHHRTLARHSGLAGVRDHGLLEAAVAMPRQRFAGELLHPDPVSMASAYLYHLCSNHPFHDGNKRVAVLAALVFLDANGVKKLPPPGRLEKATMSVAAGELSKDDLTEWMRQQTDE